MIKIVSLHIAKTAGTTFYNILQDQYPTTVDPRTKRKDFFPEGKERKLTAADFGPSAEVVHAHLRYWHIAELHREYKPFLITWLRHPVERVISNYYFMLRAVHQTKNHPHEHKRYYTLMEYAYDSIPDKMCHYLEGISPEEIDFIGFQERFSEDIQVLAALLGWASIPVLPRLNIFEPQQGQVHYPTPPDTISTAIREEIARINACDMQLYHDALRLKKLSPMKDQD